MKQYIKAEFELFKKQKGVLIGGGFILFLFAFLLLFSGVGNAFYCAAVTVLGCIAYVFFVVATFLSPASHWENRRKIIIPTEQMVLLLGESERTYIKIKMIACGLFYLAILGAITILQVPAAFIAGKQYSLWGFGLEVLIFTAVVFLGLTVLFLVPLRVFSYAIIGWCGMVGGFVGGYFGVFAEGTKAQAFERFWLKTLFCVGIGIVSVLFRWLRAIGRERGGFFVKNGEK